MADQYKQIGDLDVVSSLSNNDKLIVETVAGTRAITGSTLKGSVTKEAIGLGNVDNTSDLNKPISTATQEALDEISNNLSTNYLTKNNASGTYLSKSDAEETYVQSEDLATVATTGQFSDLLSQPSFVSRYIPAGTVINVGTGQQFTKLQSAYNYLENKWSDGTVTIQLLNNVSEQLTFNKKFNIPKLIIQGDNNTTRYITSASTMDESTPLLTINDNQNIKFRYLYFENLTSTNLKYGVLVKNNSSVEMELIQISGFTNYCLNVKENSKVLWGGNTNTRADGKSSSSKVANSVISELGGIFELLDGSMMWVNDSTTAFLARTGGKNIIGSSVDLRPTGAVYNPTLNANATGQTGWNFKV